MIYYKKKLCVKEYLNKACKVRALITVWIYGCIFINVGSEKLLQFERYGIVMYLFGFLDIIVN